MAAENARFSIVWLVLGRAPWDPKTQVRNHTKTGVKGQRKRTWSGVFFARFSAHFSVLFDLRERPSVGKVRTDDFQELFQGHSVALIDRQWVFCRFELDSGANSPNASLDRELQI